MRKCFLTRVALTVAAFVFVFTTIIAPSAHAEDLYVGPMAAFMMSPMTSRVSLKPGDTHTGSFWLTNPEENTASVNYSLSVKSFYRDNDSKAIFEDVEGRGQMAKWITLEVPDHGSITPNDSVEVKYTIKVPFSAPGGGQYAAITATSTTGGDGGSGSATISESVSMAHTIFAEIAGQTKKSAEINNLDTAGFLFDGDIVARSKVSNTGNVHGTATYTLEVYSLFSDSPIYSNASDPEKKLILPDRTLIHETTFENTPAAGFFNVHYKVEFESGEVKELNKFIIKCPVWVIFIILLVIIGLIIFIIVRAKSRKEKRAENLE